MSTHNAPQVTYPVGRSAFLGALLFGICLTGALVAGFWGYSSLVDGWRLWLAVACVIASSCAAARLWQAAPVGHVIWDGQLWRWQSRGYSSGEMAVQVQVALDVQAALWLRLENADKAVLWLWAEKAALPHRWMDLRRAAFSAVHTPHVLPAAALLP